MKKTLLWRWCDKAWLYVLYLLGIIMLVILAVNWSSWEIPQRLICILAVMVPAHVFEENTYPGGFFFINNVGQGSDEPLVYPQNMVTNMVTNFTAEIIMIILTIFAKRIPVTVVTVVIIFGIAELAHHTRDGVVSLKLYKDQGKKTVYTPGIVTSYICLLPASIYGIYWLIRNGATLSGVLGGIGVLLFIVIGLIQVPFMISKRVKSKTYAFTGNGYYSKFTDKVK